MNMFYAVLAMGVFAFISYQLTDGRDRRHKRRIEKRYAEYQRTRKSKANETNKPAESGIATG